VKKSPEKPPPIAPEDVTLFRTAVGAVNPLPEQNQAIVQKARNTFSPHQNSSKLPIPDTLSDFVSEQALDEYLSNGMARSTIRKIRRGDFPIQDSLDLHGSNTEEARKLLQEFLHHAAQLEFRCVRVIHGKGLNSQGGEGVLRKLTRHWLVQHPVVLAYCDAPAKAGGSGAALVLLKSHP